MEKEYRNIGYVFLVIVVLVIAGFYKTYFGLFPDFDEKTNAVVHFHAFVLSLWVAVMITQPLLIRYKKHDAHKRVGKFTYFLVPVVIGSFIAMMTRVFHRGELAHLSTADNLKGLLFPFADTVLLIVFYGMAMLRRKNTAIHMRYIISAALILINPTLGRISAGWLETTPIVSVTITFGSIALILLGLILFDRTHGRNYKPYVVAACFFMAYLVAFLVLYP